MTDPVAPKRAVVVIPNTTFRDALIAGLGGLLVLVFLIYGIASFAVQSKKAQSNTLTGLVLEKQFTPAPEQFISVGRKGLKTREVDGEYLLKVQIPGEDRVFEVPVEKFTYQGKRVGDAVTFLRPPSER